MGTKAGRKILSALQELVDAAESGEPLERRFTVRAYALDAEPREYDGPAVRALRDRYGMSQGVFARFLGTSARAVMSWEQGARVPSTMARRFLDELAASPEHFRARFAALATVKGAVQPDSKRVAEGKRGGLSDAGGERAIAKGPVKAR